MAKTKEEKAAEAKIKAAEEAEAKVKADRSTKSKASRAKRLKAIALLISFVKENTEAEDVPKDVTAAMNRLSGKPNRSSGTSKRDVILAYVKENGPVDETTIFGEFQLGRMEMRSISNDLIKKVADPRDRVWIGFDPESGEYSIDGEGADAPDGWTGYTPVVVETIVEGEEEEDSDEEEDEEDSDEE